VLGSSTWLWDALTSGARQGLLLGGALGLSHVGVAVAEALDSADPLNLALVATLLFALPIMTMPVAAPSTQMIGPQMLAVEAAYLVVGTLAGTTFLALIGLVNGSSEDFYCAPEVPWRVEIAAFGGFALGVIEAMLRRLGRLSALGPAVYLGFFWIAPWYGFFRAPVFLAQAIYFSCEGRTYLAVAAVAITMVLAHDIGRHLAWWLARR
jgi:hypothetical protein